MDYLVPLFSLLIIYLICSFSKNSTSRALPPSPSSLPLLGHLHLLLTRTLPHHTFLSLSKQYGDLMFFRLGSINTLLVSSPAAAREVLKTHDSTFASRPSTLFSEHLAYQSRDLAFAPYGEHWRNVRRLCTLELFIAKQVEIFKPLRKAEVSALVSELRHLSHDVDTTTPVDLSEEVRNLTLNIMSRMVLNKTFSGAAASDKEKHDILLFKKVFLEDLVSASKFQFGDMFPFLNWMDWATVQKLKANFKIKDEFLEKEVEEHRRKLASGEVKEEERKDFLYVMLALGNVSNTIMKAVALDVFVAGTDTSAITVEWAMSELMRNPSAMKKAQDELERVTGRKRDLEEEDMLRLPYLQAIVKETLRLYPPAPLLIPHESTQPCKVREYDIPAKTRLLVNVYCIGRDPSVWEDAQSFVPERFLDSVVDVQGQNYELLPFGSGRRKCPGLQLGLTTVNYILGSLLNSFDWELPSGQEALDMSEAFGLTMGRAVPLKLVPRCVY